MNTQISLSQSNDPTFPAFLELIATGVKHRTRHLPNTSLSPLILWARRYSDELVSQAVRWACEQGNQPAAVVLLALLTTREDKSYYKTLFPSVISSISDLMGFAEMMTSGIVGRRSLGTGPKKQVAAWITNYSVEELFAMDQGQLPYLIKLSHPRPQTKQQEAYFGWLLDRKYDFEALPASIQGLIFFTENTKEAMLPELPGRYLETLDLTEEQQQQLVARYNWHELADRYSSLRAQGTLTPLSVKEIAAETLASPPSRVTPLLAWETYRQAENDVILGIATAVAVQRSMDNIDAPSPGAFLIESGARSRLPIPGQKMTFFEAAVVAAWSMASAADNPKDFPIYFTDSAQVGEYYADEYTLDQLLSLPVMENRDTVDALSEVVTRNYDKIYVFGYSRFSRMDIFWNEMHPTAELVTWCIQDVIPRPTLSQRHIALGGLSEVLYQVLLNLDTTTDYVEAFNSFSN